MESQMASNALSSATAHRSSLPKYAPKSGHVRNFTGKFGKSCRVARLSGKFWLLFIPKSA